MMQTLQPLLNHLLNAGWHQASGLQLANALTALLEQPHFADWGDMRGRLTELVAILHEFVAEPPTPQRLKPILNGAERLLTRLQHGSALAHLTASDLPANPADYTFALVGSASTLATRLETLGFGVRCHPDAAIGDSAKILTPPPAVLIAPAPWLRTHSAELVCEPTAGLPRPTTIVAVATDQQHYWQAYHAGAHAVIDAAPEQLAWLAQLAGQAWLPQQPYRIVCLDPQANLTPYTDHLRQLGCQLLISSGIAAEYDAVTAFAPELCIVALSSDCHAHLCIAALRHEPPLTQLPVLYCDLSAGTAAALAQGWTAATAVNALWLTAPLTLTSFVSAALTQVRTARYAATQLRQQQRVWRELQDIKHALDRHAIISMADVDGAIIGVNDKFCQISGYNRAELLGRNHRLVKSNYHPTSVFEGMWHTITSGYIWQGEVQNRRKNGQPYWVQATIAPILDEQGQPERYISIRTDITEHKQLLEERQRQTRLLDILRQTLEQFITQQDMTATATRFLDELRLLTESTHAFIVELLCESDGEQRVQLHAVSGISAPYQAQLAWSFNAALSSPLQQLITNSLRTGEVIHTNMVLRLSASPTDHLPLHNFLGIPMGRDTIRVGLVGLANCPTGYDVSDSDLLQAPLATYGSLIEAARLRAIQQRVIAELQHGQTTTDGATDLPAPVTPSTATGCILVVDDNPTNQTVLRMQLELLGYSVECANDGASALTKWQARDYALILTDLNMPGMDGFALARSIRAAEQAHGGHLPIIAITANDDQPELLTSCHQVGIDEVLLKPLRLDSLRQRLAALLERSAAPAALTPASAPPGQQLPILDAVTITQTVGTISPRQWRELVDLLTTTVRTELRSCEQLRHRGDLPQLGHIVHKIKASAQMVGALRMAEVIANLETAIKAGQLEQVTLLLTILEQAVSDVEMVARRLTATATLPLASAGAATAVQLLPQRVLVVDDDVVARQQVRMLLTVLGVQEVITRDNGETALAYLATVPAQHCDLIITDLRMPGMDGIAFLRQLAQMQYGGALMIVSSVDAQLLYTAGELITAKGLKLRGVIPKPLTREVLLKQLAQCAPSPATLAAAGPPPMFEVSAADILAGIAAHEFTAHFQPKVDANTLRVVGVESLARWQHGGRWIRPDIFIRAAEQQECIAPLSQHLLAHTLDAAVTLTIAGFPLSMAFNLSANWLSSNLQLPELLLAELHARQLPAEMLVLEITETSLMSDLTTALDVLTRLRLHGFKLSIDDFGTGYSSMEQLQRIPFSELKLDRSFVHGAIDRPAMRTILSASVDIARKLNLMTVAEGVETQADLDLVRGLGCDLIQGWLVAKAMSLDDLIPWLQEHTDHLTVIK